MSGIDVGWQTINDWIVCQWPNPCAAWAPPTVGIHAVWGSPGSLHPGGCNLALGDASVRFVSETTAQSVLLNIARIADGQPVSGF